MGLREVTCDLASLLTASSTLSISPKHLREISDPILSLLTQLHKLVYVTQLAPPLSPSARWTLVQRYKRSLFGSGSSALTLKTHLHRLVSASTDAVGDSLEEGLGAGEGEELGSGVRLVQGALCELGEGGEGSSGETTLTYEILQRSIDSLATEHGY